jgi:hypothetical protein
MKSNSIKCLQAVLWMVCASHIILGAGLVLIPGMAPFVAGLYGAEVNWTPEFTYILKPLGAFMFALGLICIGAARNPLQNRVIIYSFVTLFVIRSLQRLVFGQEISEVFSIEMARNMGNMVFFLALAASLVIFERMARAEPAVQTGAAG